MFGAMSLENVERIKRQNELQISVIMGNPPYNANQMNENDNNKNRPYPDIDKRIKDTFIKESTAQKTKVYDMYARFYRWAFDRMSENGIITFITNRSFIDSRTFDGFRKMIEKEFDFAYVLDTASDVRANPKIAGTTHNVFGIQTGVAILFLVKKKSKKPKKCKIEYRLLADSYEETDSMLKAEKLDWFTDTRLEKVDFEQIRPDKKANWINLTDNDFDDLMPVCSKDVKRGKSQKAIFQLFSLGVVTNRDEWVYDFNKKNLERKVRFFCNFYQAEKLRWKKSDRNIPTNDFVDRTIKWTSELENHLKKGTNLLFSTKRVRTTFYRPFIQKLTYFDRFITHRPYQNEHIFGIKDNYINTVIYTSGMSTSKPFQCLITHQIAGLDFLEKTQCLPFYRYEDGKRLENITDWALGEFRETYKVFENLIGLEEGLEREIEKIDIFHYVYGVLHNPEYRQKYEQNLKRDFPRIPFYKDFWQWADWGKELMHLHLNYETAKKYPLKKTDKPLKNPEATPKAKLRRDKKTDEIILDEVTTLSNIPTEAWDYKLGNRSALEWILDQYKEKKPRDKTIAEKFNTYRFADYKESVIDLLRRVCTVSVETMRIIGEMEKIEE